MEGSDILLLQEQIIPDILSFINPLYPTVLN